MNSTVSSHITHHSHPIPFPSLTPGHLLPAPKTKLASTLQPDPFPAPGWGSPGRFIFKGLWGTERKGLMGSSSLEACPTDLVELFP